MNDRLAEVNISCGQVMVGTGKALDALRHFQEALSVEPRNGAAMEGLGRALEALKAIAVLQGNLVKLPSRGT